MKKLKVLLPILLCLPLCISSVGCKNLTFDKAAYNTTAASAVSADTAIHVWADYVARQKQLKDPVPLEQEIRAKGAWNHYQDCRDAVISAGSAYSAAKARNDQTSLSTAQANLNAAAAAMSAASADLVSLLQSFGLKL